MTPSKVITSISRILAASGLGVRTVTALLGLGLLTGGLAMISIPAALIIPGSLLLLASSAPALFGVFTTWLSLRHQGGR